MVNTINGVRRTEAATAAASAARRLAKDERLVAEIVDRMRTMPTGLLAALLTVVLAELERRPLET